MLRGQEDALDAGQKLQLQGKIDAVRNTLENGEVDSLRQKTKDLLQVVQEIGTALHQAAGAPESGSSDSTDTPEDVIDGEFTEA